MSVPSHNRMNLTRSASQTDRRGPCGLSAGVRRTRGGGTLGAASRVHVHGCVIQAVSAFSLERHEGPYTTRPEKTRLFGFRGR